MNLTQLGVQAIFAQQLLTILNRWICLYTLAAKVDRYSSNITVIWTPLLSGLWLGVDLRLNTKNTYVLEEIGLRAQTMLSILSLKRST